MKRKQHGGARAGAGRKAEDAEGELEQKSVLLDKPTIARAKQIGEGEMSRGVRIAVKAYPVKERK